MKKLTKDALNVHITGTFEPMPDFRIDLRDENYGDEAYSPLGYWKWEWYAEQWVPTNDYTDKIADAWKLWELMKADPHKMHVFLHKNLPPIEQRRNSPVENTMKRMILGLSSLTIAYAYYEWKMGERAELIKESDASN